jgi:hypothetical protein
MTPINLEAQENPRLEKVLSDNVVRVYEKGFFQTQRSIYTFLLNDENIHCILNTSMSFVDFLLEFYSPCAEGR